MLIIGFYRKMKVKTVNFMRYAIEREKSKGEEIGLIFDRQGFVVKIENFGTFSKENIVSLGDKLVSITSENRTYFPNLFCLSINNQKWAKFVCGKLHIEMMKMTNNKRKSDYEEGEKCAKKIKA